MTANMITVEPHPVTLFDSSLRRIEKKPRWEGDVSTHQITAGKIPGGSDTFAFVSLVQTHGYQ